MTVVMIVCAACSSGTTEGSRFCPSCGALFETPASLPTETSARSEPAVKAGASLDRGRFVPGAILAKRYRIIALLGRGGMGEVYRADDLKLGQPVALKFLPAAVERDPGRLDRFLNEVKVALKVTHANVCRVFDIGEVDGHHFLSMEYVDGEDLASLLRRIGRLPRDKAVQIARQFCAGLAAAHEQGILHRDLKPANVMIDGRGRAKITDFGLASLAEAIGHEDVRAGTPLYMAPEQLAGRGVTVRSDIYSLGLVLYELFTGKRAFEATTPAEMQRLTEESAPKSPSSHVEGLDPAVERAILRCLEKDPARRPPSALAVAASLPGGDPLAAALAAGETPSPEMVADAGTTEGLRPGVAIACLAGIALFMGCAVALSKQFHLLPRLPLPKPPEILAEKAREILTETGSSPVAADSEWGFRNAGAYLRYVEKEDKGPRRWDSLGTVRPPPIEFWLYQSPRSLEPVLVGWWVSPEDPPQTVPGSAITVLDPAGRLLELQIIPPELDRDEAPSGEPDWSKLFARAGLDAALLKPSRPKWNPLVSCDRREAWEGTFPDQPGIPIHVEAGAYRGKPVYFRIVPPWAETGRTAPVEARGQFIIGIFATIILGLIFAVGAYLVRRNLRLGRGDRRGAFRFARVIFVVQLLAFTLPGHHVLALSEMSKLLEAIAWSLLRAGMVWMVYLALEPYVRRLWPQCLIAWSRLIAGRFRDPLVGRDVLLGGAARAALLPLGILVRVSYGWWGLALPAPGQAPLGLLRGLRFGLANLLGSFTAAFTFPLVLLFFILVLRIVLRRQWLAVTVIVGVSMLIGGVQSEHPWISAPSFGLVVGVLLFVLLRLGLVALISTMLLGNAMNAAPLTSDLSVWYAGPGLLLLGLVFALYAYAFYISLAGRPIFQKSILPE